MSFEKNRNIKPVAIAVLRVYNNMKHFLLFRKMLIRKKDPEKAERINKYNKARPLGPQKYFCFAPFKSLYFGANGEVISCCYNRKYVLGTFPSDTLKEIWHGSKLKKLRKAIEMNDLSLGCSACMDQFDDENYDAILSVNYDKIPFNKDFPTLIEFEISNTCNLGCIMCDEKFSSFIAARKHIPVKEMPYNKDFVEQLDEFIPYLTEAKFLGGEPFLITLYFDIWEKIIAINPGCRIVVQTNGTILPDKVKQLIEKGNFHFNVSLDSFRKETYESIRINADFEKTMENFHYLYEYCKKRNNYIGVTACPIQQNWQELPEMVRYGNKLDFTVYFNRVWTPAECALWGWDSENLLMVYNKLKDETFEATTETQHRNVQHYNEIIRQIHTWHLESKSKE